MFRCNLSKGASFDSIEGALLQINFDKKINTFNERTLEYASRYVFVEDYERYVSVLNSEALLAGYYRGERTEEIEYRECLKNGTIRWIQLKIEMVQYQDSEDIEIFLMYENIDDKKKNEQITMQKVENDPLTGILNRFAFKDKLEQLFASSESNKRHALILLDIDNFKLLNDSFGHATGDQELVDIAKNLSRVMDKGDFVGRLGGDEFIICLNNIPNISFVEKKASQIQSLIRKSISREITISASLGISLYPEHGTNFNVLYHKGDDALYIAKGSGKDTYHIYSEDTGTGIDYEEEEITGQNSEAKNLIAKRRMIVIDDDTENQNVLEKVFHDDYFIIYAKDEKTALIRIRLYGKAISVIYLNIDSTGIDGYYVLEQLQKNKELKFIPVVIIGNISQREMCLRMITMGASDFVLKPLDENILRIRTNSAICKSENEMLHDENSLLSLQRDLETKYHAVFENIGTVVIEYNWLGGTFSYDSTISKYIAGNFDDRPLWQILLSDMVASSIDVSAMQNMVHGLAEKTNQPNGSMEVMLKTPDKHKHWFSMHAFRRLNEFNVTSKIIITFTDINDDVLADEKLKFQAERDDLTGIYNRRTFLKKVEEEVRNHPANTFYLFMGDIDNFKFINERFGRQKGDELLQYTAEKLSNLAVKVDLCGRLLNDNFAILIRNEREITEKIKPLIENLYENYPLGIRITCTTGGYLIDDQDIIADDILDKASLARDSIKGKYGEYFAVYNDSMIKKIQQEKEITNHMEEALANREFQVYYQPQFNHATRQIVGVEALARWISPQKGMIMPGVFIPVFEKNGFITKLDEFVWNRAAMDMRNWMERGYNPVPVSVNVSREDTNDPKLCDKLLDIVRRNNIPIELFRLEITESLFVEDAQRLIEVVDKLHSLGFLIEMDDFGSGYSSLNILKDVSVDVLKLDLRFFYGDKNLDRGGAIVNAVMRMSRWLRMPVIAEGVETKEQADFLLSLNCHVIQGYLYGKPMPHEEFEKNMLDNEVKIEKPPSDIVTDIKMDDFWNPKSWDSQIFNSYIGAAVIFEFWNGEYEIIRTNRQFIDTLQLKQDYMLPTNDLLKFLQHDRTKFDEAVKYAVQTSGEVKVDLKGISGADDSMISIHAIMRVIAKSKERTLFFATIEKIES